MDFDPQLHPRAAAGRFGKAEKLEKLADSIDLAADAKLGQTRNTNTFRRARMASSAEGKAREDKSRAIILRRIAAAHRDGSIGPHLGKISNRAQLDEVILARSMGQSRASSRGTGKPIDHVEYQHGSIGRTDARWLAEHFEKQGDHHQEDLALAHSLVARLPSYEDRLSLADETLHQQVSSLLENAKASGYRTSQDFGIPDRKRLRGLGVSDTATLKAAVAELDALGDARIEEDPVKKLERALVGRKIPGFFPTPPAHADELVRLALISPGMRVLEPSAGTGNIAESARRAGGDVTVLERDGDLARVLEARKFVVAGRDALSHEGLHDRVIMNPPFEGGADGDHVRYAFENNLRPGGRLVSIVGGGTLGNSQAKSVAFRAWLEERGATIKMLPAGTFEDRSQLRTTGASAGIVIIDKPRAGPGTSAGFSAELITIAPEKMTLPPGSVTVDLAVRRQEENYTCGPAVLAGLSAAWGHPWGEKEWAEATLCDEEGGAAPEDVVRALVSQGFGATLREGMTAPELFAAVEAGIPVLCVVQAWSGGHWVAVVGCPSSQIGRVVIVQDPVLDPPLGHRSLAEWESCWHDSDKYGRVWRRLGILVTRPLVTSQLVPREDPDTATMGLDFFDRWLAGMVGFARRDPALWKPHVIGKGKRKGVLVWKNVNTGRLADSIAAVHAARGVPGDLDGATFEPGLAGIRTDNLGVNHEVTGTLRKDGKRYFYKGVGTDAGNREQLVSDAALLLGVLTPNATHRVVAGAPAAPGKEGGVVAQWLPGETLMAGFRSAANQTTGVVKNRDKVAHLERLEKDVLRPGEVDRIALFNFALGVEDRHPGQVMVVGDRLASIDHDFSLWKAWSLHEGRFRDPLEHGAGDVWEAGPLSLRPGGTDAVVFDREVVREMAAQRRAVVLLVDRNFPEASAVVDRHFRVLEKMARTSQTSVTDMRRFLAEEIHQ